MKKKILVVILIVAIILILVGPYIAIEIKSFINKDILTSLKGEIYYTKRDNLILNLYKLDANLDNKKLIYSHKNKGLTNFGDYNDNIIDFYYDRNTGEINFIAMNDGSFSLFSIKEGDKNPMLIGKGEELLNIAHSLDKTDYISNQQGDAIAVEKKGSIYIIENGKETCVKKFYGIYDSKFTGYRTIGFSPDGKHLIYSSMEHLTPIGSLLNHLINGFNSNIYIMDLDTGESSKFIDSYDIQWVMD